MKDEEVKCKDCRKIMRRKAYSDLVYQRRQCPECYTKEMSEVSRREIADVGKPILEKLANLEHQQWAHWTKYMLDNLTPDNIKRWRDQIVTPYSQLSEKEKETDREWARKVVKIIDSA